MVRISEMYRFQATQNRINMNRAHADEVQETATSGRKLRKVSDDPVSAVRALRNRSKLDNIQEYKKTIDFASGYLQKTEDALRGITEALIRGKELCIQQASGTWDEKTREIVASEVKQIGDQIVELGNSTYGDKFVFGGFRSTTPPVDSEGHFLGDDGVIYVQITDDFFRPINISGRDLFEIESTEEGKQLPLVQVFRKLEYALRNDDLNDIHGLMGKLDASIEKVVSLTSSLGARRSNLDNLTSMNEREEEQTYLENNRIESADFVESAMNLKTAETSLNYTLNSSAKLLSPSLLQFLGGS
jgi:flagellar hook-associated protein 3 FlgL